MTYRSFASLFSKKFFLNSFIEFTPILLFAASFYVTGPYHATFILMVSTLISTYFAFKLERRIPYIPIYIALITLIFGYMTLHLKNFGYIQLRDTIYDLTLAFTLIGGLFFNKLMLKTALGTFVNLSDQSWRKLTYYWIFIFLSYALFNEYFRKNYDDSVWLSYKLGIVFVTTLLVFFTLYIVFKKESSN